MSINKRLTQLNSHFIFNETAATKTVTIADQTYVEVIDSAPHYKNKLDYFNKQGWGY